MAKKPPPGKSDVSALLAEMSVILDILGENPFKVRAYANAARALDTLTGDFAEMVASRELLNVRGIGKGIFENIEIFVETGELPYYDELRGHLPYGLLELLQIPGMGPKKVKAVYEELGVTSLAALEDACEAGEIAQLDGFGEKSQDKILTGIQNLKKYRERHLLDFAMAEASGVFDAVTSHPDVVRAQICGSLRRFYETVKDIDIVASAKKSEAVMEHFVGLPGVDAVIAHGDTKSSVVLVSGINVDLRVVSDTEFPYAVHHFTGSKEHNTQMRARAKKMGMKMNEYGLFKGEKLVPCKDEEAIFKKLGLAYIPPELREGWGEIEAAETGELPVLLEESDLRGLFHCHTTWSDGKHTIRQMADAAQALGFEYLGIADHSQSAGYAGGLKPAAIKKQAKEVAEVNDAMKGFTVFHGIESDILPDGSLDYKPEVLEILDFVIVSVHSSFGMSEADMTKRIITAIQDPHTTMLGHPTGRLLLQREGYKVNLDAVIEAAAEHNVIIELNSHPHRLDLDWRMMKFAREKGVRIAINPDAHNPEGLSAYHYGVGIARKGWMGTGDVINTLRTNEMRKFLTRPS